MTCQLGEPVTRNKSMTLADFNTSIRDLRRSIRSAVTLGYIPEEKRYSKFFKFDIDNRTQSFGIWNVMTKNVVAYVNPGKRVVYVRRNSKYADSLTGMEGYTVIKSDSLNRHRNYGSSHNQWYKLFYGKPQYTMINNLTESTNFTIDLGYDKARRGNILSNIHGNLVRRTDMQAIVLVAENVRGENFKRRYEVRLGPPAPVEEPTSGLDTVAPTSTGATAPSLTTASIIEAHEALRRAQSPFGIAVNPAVTEVSQVTRDEVDMVSHHWDVGMVTPSVESFYVDPAAPRTAEATRGVLDDLANIPF